MDLRFDKVEMQGLTKMSNELSDSEYVRKRAIEVAQTNGFIRGSYKWSSRSELALAFSGGPHQVKRIEGTYTYPGYEMGINYSIRMSSLRSFKASARSTFRAINPLLDIPAPLISGNA